MKMLISDELRSLLEKIVNENKTNEEWAEIESDDMFQSESFQGGFDATEDAFCFSFYRDDGKEFWFQLTLDEVNQAVSHAVEYVDLRPAS